MGAECHKKYFSIFQHHPQRNTQAHPARVGEGRRGLSKWCCWSFILSLSQNLYVAQNGTGPNSSRQCAGGPGQARPADIQPTSSQHARHQAGGQAQGCTDSEPETSFSTFTRVLCRHPAALGDGQRGRIREQKREEGQWEKQVQCRMIPKFREKSCMGTWVV